MSSRVFGDPDDVAVALARLRFEADDVVVHIHQAQEFAAPGGIDVQLVLDIAQRVDHLLRNAARPRAAPARRRCVDEAA
jgi:hypothetical protein